MGIGESHILKLVNTPYKAPMLIACLWRSLAGVAGAGPATSRPGSHGPSGQYPDPPRIQTDPVS